MASSSHTTRLTLSSGQRGWVVRSILALGVALLMVAVTHENILKLGVVQRLELAALDYRFQYRGVRQTVRDSSHVVIVEISEESFRSVPDKFPWPRSYYAHLVRNLKAAGAKAVGIDLILSGSDETKPADDSAFSDAIRETGVVVLAGSRESDKPLYRQSSAKENFGNMFYDGTNALGLVNIRPDADGVYRLYNTMFLVDSLGQTESAVPTFGFGVLNTYLGLPPRTTAEIGDHEFHYAGRTIPAYDPASMMINYYGPNGTFRHIAFHTVIDDSTFTTTDEAQTGQSINTFSDPDFGYLYDGTFQNKIVLVGVTVPEYKDLFPVSIGYGRQRGDNLMYGVEIHANVIENVLRNDFLTKQSAWGEIATTFFATLLCFFAISLLKEIPTRHTMLLELLGLAATATLVVVVAAVGLLLFVKYNYVVMMMGPSSGILAGYATSTMYHFVAERRERMLIKSMFSAYVHPSVVDELISHPEKLVLGGERKEMTVLFSDIEGFTTISQQLAPEDLVGLLNDYLSIMTEVILRNHGTLDKYIGDAVMGFWGAPMPRDDHAYLACRAALEMQRAMHEINIEWKSAGRPTFRTRIGLNTGPMVVGNMGGSGKFSYSVVGDSVNLASRLEGANKEYGTAVMVSGTTYGMVRDQILGRELDRIAVKGRSEPVTVFELLHERDRQPGPDEEEFLAHYARGLESYYSRAWKDSRSHFSSALRIRPDDIPARIHLERIAVYTKHAPPVDWNGVHIMKTK